MKYSLILSILFYICGCFYMIFGAYIVVANVKSNVNKLFVFMTSTLAVWSFAFSFSTSAPTAELSAFWGCVSVFGWGVFYSVMFRFVLILTKARRRLNKWVRLAVIYVPALINIILFAPFGFLGAKQFRLVQSDFGWVNTLPINMGNIWFIVYYSVFTIGILILIIRWIKRIEPDNPLKRQAIYFLISAMFPLFMGVSTETIPDLLGITSLPKLTVIFLMVPVISLFSLLKKINMLVEKSREKTVFRESEELLEDERLRLFQTVAAVFTIGAAITFLVRYFGIKKPLTDELLLAAVLLSSGILVRIIPYITKKHTIQNALFQTVSTLSILFFLKANTDTGALTIWSIYILFLLFTVVLDSKIHATVFTILMVIIQIVFWIFYPEVAVTIDGNEYISRIAIIVLSYFAVRYLTAEYASKVEAYKKFAREQEVLEQISTNFISVNRENAKEKIEEMFKMSVETLGFDNAYLIGFSEGNEDANVFSSYTKEFENDSFPYYSGMKIKMATLPVAKALIAQGTPLICEDIKNTFRDGCGEARNFLISRGINSFYALPLTIGEEQPIDGMLVIEYYERSKESLRESRLYFLNIIVNMLRDTRQKILYEEMLYNFAYFDETTKLANRNMLKKRLEQIIDARKESEKIAVLGIEIENLRMIKDTFGHDTGEQIMIEAAKNLDNLLENCCDISRKAEGEFVVVLPDAENTKQIKKCAKRLLDSFSHPVSTRTGIEALFVVVHMGISVYPDDGRDADTLLKNADLAVYQAKNTNEDIVFYTELLENNIAETTLFTNRLFKSLQNEEFFLEFQPQINCETGQIVGIEALLRWTVDGTERVPPDRFIPILEHTGLIYDVGLWVLEQALQEHNRLIAKGFPPLRVSVNLSVVQFQREEFIPDFAKIIEESGADPKYIELEITESLFSKDPEDVLNKIYKLKDLGVRIAIDDFGKGYSSLSRLKVVPFDRIKIDKEIIDYIDLERKLAPLTEIIILLARTFKAGITAEGVETKEQADFLKSIDCDEIQGYYYSRPLSSEALEEFLKNETNNPDLTQNTIR